MTAMIYTLRISIHAPRTGSDGDGSHGGRIAKISIHAPRTGSDASISSSTHGSAYFNPRSPHGERPEHTLLHIILRLFQSTLPARGATGTLRRAECRCCISIHAPRTGSDGLQEVWMIPAQHISIHAPRTGSDRHKGKRQTNFSAFQSTLPARGATRRFASCT